jgi:hypothetical protein
VVLYVKNVIKFDTNVKKAALKGDKNLCERKKQADTVKNKQRHQTLLGIRETSQR